jgi:glycosyltransferase involved in cell wall biosynthesis
MDIYDGMEIKMEKEKILIFMPGHAQWGGGHIYVDQLCSFLDKNGKNTIIASNKIDGFGCKCVKLPNLSSKIKRFFYIFLFSIKYRSRGIKKIILNDLSSLWLAPVFWLFGFKVISLLHLYMKKRSENPMGHSVAEYWILKLSSFFCSAIFSVNRENVEVFGRERVQFIGNFVPEWFVAKSTDAEAEKSYDFLLVSRLSREKNISLFLKLLRELGRRGREYRALIVGEGEEREEIERLVDEYGLRKSVVLKGWKKREELPAIYDSARCFVISSLHEGFATTLLEAHARGLPAIVTSTSGFCVDFVQGYGGRSGLVFEEKDIYDSDFLYRVERLLSESRNYSALCIDKARIFSEENVLGPILKSIEAL